MKSKLTIALFIVLCTVSLIYFLMYKGVETENKNLQSVVDSLRLTIKNAPEVTPMINVADLYSGVNAERAKNGLAELKINTSLEVSACAKANDMAAKNYWAHVAPDGTEPWFLIMAAGYKYSNAGENLAEGFTTASGTMEGWINSPEHENNIVGDYTDMGICTIQAKLEVVSKGNAPINIVVNHFAN